MYFSLGHVTTEFLKKFKEKNATRKIDYMRFRDCSIEKNVVLKEHFPEIGEVHFYAPKKDSKENHLVLDAFKGINSISVYNEDSNHPLSLTLLEPPSEEMRSVFICLSGNILLSNWGFLSKIAKDIVIENQSMKGTLEIPAFETNCEGMWISGIPTFTRVDLQTMSNLKTLGFCERPFTSEYDIYNSVSPLLIMDNQQITRHIKNVEPALTIKSAAIDFWDDQHPLEVFTLFPNLTHLFVKLSPNAGNFVLPQQQTLLQSLVVEFPGAEIEELQGVNHLIFDLLKQFPYLHHL
jgi:hypothetical protein